MANWNDLVRRSHPKGRKTGKREFGKPQTQEPKKSKSSTPKISGCQLRTTSTLDSHRRLRSSIGTWRRYCPGITKFWSGANLIGKSTLNASDRLILTGRRFSYVFGKGSEAQNQDRADRMEGQKPDCLCFRRRLRKHILSTDRSAKPDFCLSFDPDNFQSSM